MRISVGIPTGGFGRHLDGINAWLDENCGADGWAITPAGLRGSSTMRSRSISRMRRSPAPLSAGGALVRSRRPSEAPSGSGTTRQRREGRKDGGGPQIAALGVPA